MAKREPVINPSQVFAAGLASTTAAVVTSKFGVAGTILGAALTTMIITGGAAILNAYLKSLTGNVRKVPRKLRERRNRWRAGRSAEPDTIPERPDLRDNFAGRLRAALDWFSHLPPLTRRSILIKGLVAAAVAFLIGMGAIYAVEKGIGNSLSCGIWAKCPKGAKPGIHLGEDRDTGARSSLLFGRAKAEAAPGYEGQDPAYQQAPSNQRQAPGVQQAPSDQQQGPGLQRPAPSGNEPGGGLLQPDRPVQREDPAQPRDPDSASPAPGDELPGGGGAPDEEVPPSSASPAPSE